MCISLQNQWLRERGENSQSRGQVPRNPSVRRSAVEGGRAGRERAPLFHCLGVLDRLNRPGLSCYFLMFVRHPPGSLVLVACLAPRQLQLSSEQLTKPHFGVRIRCPTGVCKNEARRVSSPRLWPLRLPLTSGAFTCQNRGRWSNAPDIPTAKGDPVQNGARS